MGDVPPAPAEGEVVDLAIILGYELCHELAFLRPGGLCAECIALVGLAEDRTEYAAWRERGGI